MPKSFLLKRHSHNGSKDVDTRVLVKKAKSTSREDIQPATEFLFSTPLPYYDQEPAVFQFRSYPFPAFGPYHYEIMARDYLSQSAMHEMRYSYPIANYEKSPFRLHKPFENPVESFQTFPLLSKNEIARHPFQAKVLERKPEIELDFSRKREEIFTAFNLETEYKQDPGLKCEQCGKSFKTKYTLAIHMRMPSHTGARPFVCGVCGKGFRLSSTLCRHRIIHTSERPHKCHLCDKAFNRSSTLKTHIRTHSESKEYICETCGKGFHQKGNLRNHILIHTGEKPYRCRLCEKAFNKLSNLKFHMHVHTDNSPYRCRFCKVTFTRRCDLKSHIANVHEEDARKE